MKSQGPVPRNTHNRRETILEMLQQNHRVSVGDLSQAFKISEVSIRRDLDYLEKAGVAQRVHGGAKLAWLAQPGTVFDTHLRADVKSKASIGQAAACLIHPGETIMLDSGATILEVARNIPRNLLGGGGLTIVTRSLSIAMELRKYRQIRLIVLGGMYISEYDDFVGSQVETALHEMHVNTLFIGAEGITLERGLTTDNLLEASLYQHLVSIADRVVVVASANKFGVNRLQTLLPLDTVHSIITDNEAPETILKTLRERGLEVVSVPSQKE
jgi:DeoR family transcriptional regulator, aga operon transcriptional repressor